MVYARSSPRFSRRPTICSTSDSPISTTTHLAEQILSGKEIWSAKGLSMSATPARRMAERLVERCVRSRFGLVDTAVPEGGTNSDSQSDSLRSGNRRDCWKSPEAKIVDFLCKTAVPDLDGYRWNGFNRTENHGVASSILALGTTSCFLRFLATLHICLHMFTR